jgi:hypothetical protein
LIMVWHGFRMCLVAANWCGWVFVHF